MIKRAVLAAVLVTAAFFGCSSNEVSKDMVEYKIPGDVIAKTSAFIMTRTGSEFFSKNFRFDQESSAIDSPYYHVAYRFTIPGQPLIDEVVTVTTDADGKIEGNVTGIPECTKDTTLCSFTITEEGAREIARNNDLGKGIKEWETEFIWSEKEGQYVWLIRSVSSEGKMEGGGYRGNGEQIIIDPATGVVLEKSDWFVR